MSSGERKEGVDGHVLRTKDVGGGGGDGEGKGGEEGGFGGGVEGVAVRGGKNVPGLEVNGATEEGGEGGGGGVGAEERAVGRELVGAVAEPHGVDVARGDVGELGGGLVVVVWEEGGSGEGGTSWSSSVPLPLSARPFQAMAVSSVLGKQFSKRRKRSGSRMVRFMAAMVSSTSARGNLRHRGAGRW